MPLFPSANYPTPRPRYEILAAVLFAVFGLSAGCRSENAYVPPPPPEVVVGVPEQRPVTIYHDYTGTTSASQSVDLRARVSGYLDSIHYKDGSTVPQGQLLFVIDRRPYAAQLDQAKAELESKQATLVQTESIYRRDLALVSSGAVSQEQADIDRGNYLVAQAGVLQAQAAVRQAELNFNFTEIHAPIGGRTGRHQVDPGSLVSADNTILTTIVQYDPMYVYFNVSETNYLAYLKRQREKSQAKPEKQGAAGQPARTPIDLGLANETGYPHQGYIDFSEPTVNPGTGTLQLRGVFANPPPYRLAAGLFARIRVPVGTQSDALLVPDAALGTDQAGRYLLVVLPNNTVERREVQTGPRVGTMRVVEEGLKPVERIVVQGLQRARPGIEVKPVEASETAAPQAEPSPAHAPGGGAVPSEPSQTVPPGAKPGQPAKR